MLGIGFYDITDPDMHSERQHEIYNWLEHHSSGGAFYRRSTETEHGSQIKKRRPIDAWVAIDDEELLQGDGNALYAKFFEGHVVKTESSVGLTMADAEEAVAILQLQLGAMQKEAQITTAATKGTQRDEMKNPK